jgi:hypothetical protein
VTPAQRHMERIAAMPCICCRLLGMQQQYKSNVHHIRQDREARNDFLTLPLCLPCHQGEGGVHGDKRFLRMLKMSEWALLAKVIEELENERS